MSIDGHTVKACRPNKQHISSYLFTSALQLPFPTGCVGKELIRILLVACNNHFSIFTPFWPL